MARQVRAAALAVVVLIGAASCGSASAQLAVPEGAGGSFCAPAGEDGEVLFANDILINAGSTPAEVVSVELVDASNLEVTSFATLLHSEDGFRGVANGLPDTTDPDGESNPIPPDTEVTIQAALRLLDSADGGRAEALRISYADEGGGATEVAQTAFALEVVPPNQICDGK